jgi:hypothetical protein
MFAFNLLAALTVPFSPFHSWASLNRTLDPNTVAFSYPRTRMRVIQLGCGYLGRERSSRFAQHQVLPMQATDVVAKELTEYADS